MKWLKLILTVICLGCTLSVSSASPQWEHVSANVQTYDADDSEKIEVSVRDGYIYISTSRQVTVKVMSILGQLISQQTVPPGISRLKVSARGIYILKVGTFTTRVTV